MLDGELRPASVLLCGRAVVAEPVHRRWQARFERVPPLEGRLMQPHAARGELSQI